MYFMVPHPAADEDAIILTDMRTTDTNDMRSWMEVI